MTPRRRPGFSLIEMLVVVTLSGIVLALVGYSLEVMIRSVRGVQRQTEAAGQIDALAAQFRADVHSGEIEMLAEMPEGAMVFRILRRGQPAIDYAATPAGIVTRTIAGGIGPVQRESFELPTGTRVRLDLTSPTLATLSIDRPRPGAEPTEARRRTLAITAARRADERLWEEQGVKRP